MSTSTSTLDSSITFFPFGATRTGSVSTDKKFTGQRLDGTGLYYYGARYYDASIGRFISPDTVVQNLYDPQSLNRYTYCVNNPLKYTDPSGRIVEFANEDACLNWINQALNNGEQISDSLWAMIQEWATLRYAWTELSTVAPELTSYLTNATETILISQESLGANSERGKTSPGGREGIDISITINTNLPNNSIEFLAAVLGHESLHAAADVDIVGLFPLNNVATEALAWSCGYWCGLALGCDISQTDPTAIKFADINPWRCTDDRLTVAKQDLVNILHYPSSMKPWPTGNLVEFMLRMQAIWPTSYDPRMIY